jgi:hypothetical protein
MVDEDAEPSRADLEQRVRDLQAHDLGDGSPQKEAGQRARAVPLVTKVR